jgi:hypothetical protein
MTNDPTHSPSVSNSVIRSPRSAWVSDPAVRTTEGLRQSQVARGPPTLRQVARLAWRRGRFHKVCERKVLRSESGSAAKRHMWLGQFWRSDHSHFSRKSQRTSSHEQRHDPRKPAAPSKGEQQAPKALHPNVDIGRACLCCCRGRRPRSAWVPRSARVSDPAARRSPLRRIRSEAALRPR